jgi:hypothetical protein
MRFVGDLRDCSPWETPVTWNQMGPQGPPGLPDEGAIKVHSSDGDYLGLLFNSQLTGSDGNPNTITVYVPGLKKLFQVGIEGGQVIEGFGHNRYHPLPYGEKICIYFENTDCSGTPYINLDELYANAGNHNMYYFIVTYEGMDVMPRQYEAIYYPEKISVQSRHDLLADYCEQYQGIMNNWFELKEVMLPFKYPVKLPLTFE